MKGIDPKKEYGLLEIVKLGVIGNTHGTVNRRILMDKLGKDHLKTVIGGSDKAPRYRVLGKNLRRYLEEVKA